MVIRYAVVIMYSQLDNVRGKFAPPPFSSITGRRQLVNVNGWLSDMLSVVIMYSQLDNVREKFAPPSVPSLVEDN
jgi:hypothetical protein